MASVKVWLSSDSHWGASAPYHSKMEVSEYVNKRVKVDIDNGFYYTGIVLSCGEDYIKIRDKRDKLVLISLKNVISIVEVGE